MDEQQKDFVYRLVSRLGIIETRPDSKQWRIAPMFLVSIELKILDYDGFDSAKRAVEKWCKVNSTHEERLVATSFVMEWLVLNFKNIHIPEIKDTDITNSSDLIEHLIEEEKKAELV